MTINIMGADAHFGGADVETAQTAGGRWAVIALFWEWIKANNLQNDVMVVVSQEFARAPYNSSIIEQNIVDANGKSQTIKTPGRDHGLAFGAMFINANVPKAGRVGNVSSNLTAVPSSDTKGSVISGAGYTSINIMGSMLMRVYPDLFPTERMVRKHWPTFLEIPPILS
ncbi:MAG: hypothetical protein EOO63_02715 [Hymenobacter sp.]|nr:MAG: hypothetical protein EOO63_02715 [Hymenobacter sp.]